LTLRLFRLVRSAKVRRRGSLLGSDQRNDILHGRIEIDTDVVERTIRPIASSQKNALFAGSEGGSNWAIIASLIETAALNAANPHAWLADTLTKLVNGWLASRIDKLIPWACDKGTAN
jgi:hypothetical protein